ncbi:MULTISPECIES: recombinase family protein [unclassified Streptomyces]|uniref:recombinase family protein n=1 Tax=unclassified Streptomyces TaxID=2593676 RepID=UPI001BE55304|nr:MULTISPECIES: recombinase family protein [unclassified Streptomyces]MBT2404347.1 recombinase family protein [Streptomyces sp. ISL-21]MBT2607102.1 recombinase family protein [Streptomyces sp. ISL-87]
MDVTIYVRLSLDRNGDQLGVQRQEDECRAFAAARGWTVLEVLSDNDISATSGKARPGFEALLMSKPKAILVWHTDRLVRKTEDLLRVIALGVNVHAIHAGHLDLSTPAGRATAKTITAWAEYEGEQKALRQKASNLQAAKAGKPHKAGLRTFGYADDYVTVVEAEADAIRKGAEMILQGETLAAVARYWIDLGLLAPRSSSGNAKEAAKGWGVGGVKKVLISPRYIGQATYRGEVVGKGQWPAILSEETHYGLLAILNSPTRFTGGARTGSAPQTLLAGLATCERCGETVRGGMYRGTPVYRCGQKHVRVPREIADKRAGNAVLARLVFPDFLPSILATQKEQSDDSAHLHQEAQALRERLDGLALVYASGSITLSQMTAGTEAIRARLEEVESKLSGVTGLPLLDPVSGIAGLIEGWPHTPLPVRRAWVKFITTITMRPNGFKKAAKMTVDDYMTVEWNHTSDEHNA